MMRLYDITNYTAQTISFSLSLTHTKNFLYNFYLFFEGIVKIQHTIQRAYLFYFIFFNLWHILYSSMIYYSVYDEYTYSDFFLAWYGMLF